MFCLYRRSPMSLHEFKAAWSLLNLRLNPRHKTKAIKGHLEQAGHGYHCSSDYRDVTDTLTGWGVLRSGIPVQ
jgi:hypothetical protein